MTFTITLWNVDRTYKMQYAIIFHFLFWNFLLFVLLGYEPKILDKIPRLWDNAKKNSTHHNLWDRDSQNNDAQKKIFSKKTRHPHPQRNMTPTYGERNGVALTTTGWSRNGEIITKTMIMMTMDATMTTEVAAPVIKKREEKWG